MRGSGKFTVLIADDEITFAKHIRSMINWEEHGFKIVGNALNGVESLKLIGELAPEIVLLDIKMPVLDGIDVMKEIRKRAVFSKVIIISSYADFAYAREAIECGVVNYIVKHEITPESLLKVLNQAKALVLKERAMAEEMAGLSREPGYRPQTDNGSVLRDILLGLIPSEDIHTKFLYQNPEDCMGKFLIINAKIYNLEDDADSKDYLVLTVNNIIRDLEAEFGPCRVVFLTTNEMCLLFYHTSYAGEARKADFLKQFFFRFCRIMKAKTIYSVAGFAFKRDMDIFKVRSAYQKLKKLMEYRLCFKEGELIFYTVDMQKNLLEEAKLKSKEMVAYLINSIKAQDLSGTMYYLDAIFNKIIQNSMDLSVFDHVLNEITLQLKILLKELNLETFFEIDKQALTSRHFLPDILEVLKNLTCKIINKINERKSYSSAIVIHAVDYIKRNYANDLSLSEMSEKLGVSYSYMSFIFKKETGMNFIDYLNETRIKKAVELLKEGNMKVYEVAEKVGFGNSKYFSTTFKKVTGKSPFESKNIYIDDQDDCI